MVVIFTGMLRREAEYRLRCLEWCHNRDDSDRQVAIRTKKIAMQLFMTMVEGERFFFFFGKEQGVVTGECLQLVAVIPS